MDPVDVLARMDYRRELAALYETVRLRGVGRPATWLYWVTVRDRLYTTHPHSPVPEAVRATLESVPNFPHDPALHTTAELAHVDDETVSIPSSDGGATPGRRAGVLRFSLFGQRHELPAYWIEHAGGGLFVPFRDETSGSETDASGRYLINAADNADLGATDGHLVLDFNYSYHPSSAHDPERSCPLAPPEAALAIPIRGGERLG